MFKTEDLSSAVHVATRTRADLDGLLVDALVAMADRIRQLEARLDRLSDLTVGDERGSFTDQVMHVMETCSGSVRVALDLTTADIDGLVLTAIEENSYSVFSHIEAEIDEKLDQHIGSHAFCEAVNEAIDDNRLHDAIIDAVGDAEDIVRKGLRAIL